MPPKEQTIPKQMNVICPAASVRLDYINGDIEEIKIEQKEQGKLIRLTREDLAGAKTEIRIVGGLVLSAIITMIGIYLSQ